jgi:ADP-heptose:LPS heptosyltransferase
MKVSRMRRIDAWAGVPLCFLASAFLSIWKRLFGRDPNGDPASVLVIKLSEMGALVALGPAVRELTKKVGRSNLYFLTFAESLPFLEILDYVPKQNIFILPTDSLWGLILRAVRVLVTLRRGGIDCSVDMDFFSRATALLSLASGCRKRVGCHAYFGEGPYRGNLLTHRIKFNPHLHVSQMFEVLAGAVGIRAEETPRIEVVCSPVEVPKCRFQPSATESDAIGRMLAGLGVKPEDHLVLLNSNISDRESIPLRKWSDAHYVDLAKTMLAEIPGTFVLLTGGQKEALAVARLEAEIGQERCRTVAGRTSIRELLALYTRSEVLVTNDSGPAHFATLTDVAVVVLFGPETPLLWRPLGDRVRVLYRGIACSPCFTVYNGRQSKCRMNACMEIPPATVLQAVREFLGTPPPPAR